MQVLLPCGLLPWLYRLDSPVIRSPQIIHCRRNSNGSLPTHFVSSKIYFVSISLKIHWNFSRAILGGLYSLPMVYLAINPSMNRSFSHPLVCPDLFVGHLCSSFDASATSYPCGWGRLGCWRMESLGAQWIFTHMNKLFSSNLWVLQQFLRPHDFETCSFLYCVFQYARCCLLHEYASLPKLAEGHCRMGGKRH